MEKIKTAKERWMKNFKNSKKRKEFFYTLSGIKLKPLYTPDDVSGDYLEKLGFSGEIPYTRGIYPTMYLGKFWTIRQLAGFGGAEDTASRLKFLIEKGVTGLNITFDYPTLRGFDSDDPRSAGEVGIGGVAIDILDDMEELFKDIPIGRITVSLVACNPVACAAPIYSMYVLTAMKKGVDLSKLDGTIQNDFLMETLVTHAPRMFSPQYSFKVECDIVEYASKNTPKWHGISFVGYNIREAGANAIQECGIVFAHAIAVIEELLERGLKLEEFVPNLSFFFCSHNDFFEEIAKFRAARRVWYKILRERFEAAEKLCRLKFHVQTSGASLRAQEPLNNIIRAAYQALSAVLGGCQSLHVCAFDEPFSIPTETSALVALRTQQILQRETNIPNVIDPLGGSYFVEWLTDEMEERIFDYIEKIESRGGIVKCVEIGWLHRELLNSAMEYEEKVESGEIKLVGEEDEQDIEIFHPPDILGEQKMKLGEFRKRRDPHKLNESVSRLKNACREGENVIPFVMDCLRAKATIGEIVSAFEEVFGTWKPRV